jgi:hypothetical protein
MKWFRKIGDTFDPDSVVLSEVRDELYRQPLFWGKSPRVTFPGSPHRDTEDIVLRGPVGIHSKSLQELHVEIACEDYPASELMPATLRMANNLAYLLSSPEMQHLDSPLRLGRVILTKLPPGKSIHPHKDEGAVPEFYRRCHLVVEGGDENVFLIADEVQVMQSGEMWECDVRELHTVVNLMEDARVHLIVDIER